MVKYLEVESSVFSCEGLPEKNSLTLAIHVICEESPIADNSTVQKTTMKHKTPRFLSFAELSDS